MKILSLLPISLLFFLVAMPSSSSAELTYAQCVSEAEKDTFEIIDLKMQCCEEVQRTKPITNYVGDVTSCAHSLNKSAASNAIASCCHDPQIERCRGAGLEAGMHFVGYCPASNAAWARIQQDDDVVKAEVPASTPAPASTPRAKPIDDGDEDVIAETSRPAVQSEPHAEQTAQRDIAAAQVSFGRGNRCCADPYQCGTVKNPQTQQGQSSGMKSCQQTQELANQSQAINNQLSAICSGEQRACESTIGALVTKYAQLKQQCESSSCESQGIYESTYAALDGHLTECKKLRQTADVLAAQGSSGAVAGGGAKACNDNSAMTTQSAEGAGGDPKNADKNIAQTVTDECEKNPSSAKCSNQAPSAMPESVAGDVKSLGAAAAGPVAGKTSGGFNSGSALDGGLKTGTVSVPSSDPLQYATVANNTGGGIPGGSGGSGAKAAGPAVKARPAGSGVSTDILTGFQGDDGYSQDAAGKQPQTAGDAYNTHGKMRRPASAGDMAAKNALEGADLKRYLPGGDLHAVKMSGMTVGNPQINGKSVDIWEVINNRFIERCKLGTLYSCDK